MYPLIAPPVTRSVVLSPDKNIPPWMVPPDCVIAPPNEDATELIAVPLTPRMLPLFTMFRLSLGFTTIAVPGLPKIDPLFTRVPPVPVTRNADDLRPVTGPELVTVALLL